MEKKLLTVEEAAHYLGISEEAVNRLVGKGDLAAYRIGGRLLRFKEEQLEQYRRRTRPAKPAEAGRVFASDQQSASYTFWERAADFLYYNDFYILSLIILSLTIILVFGF